jgi:GNAT superfamily N-acetyltransferase
LQAQFALLEQSDPRTARSFEIYDAASERHRPELSHYYLGVIGIDPGRQGKGGGGALLRAFCKRSDDDPDSAGTYLETANPTNVTFYEHFGFKLTGSDQLDSATQLFCFYRPKAGANTHASV